MYPWQIAALALLGAGFINHVRRDIKQRGRADEQFFTSLVERVTRKLVPKGFGLTVNQIYPKMSGLYTVRFESAASNLNLWLDTREYEVRLTRVRRDDSSEVREETLESVWLADPPTHADYARATEAILAAADAIPGAAANPGVAPLATLRVHSDPFFLTERGLSVICELVEGNLQLGATVLVSVPSGPGAASVVESAVVEFALADRRELPSLLFGAKSGSETADVLRGLLQRGVLLTLTSAPAFQPTPPRSG